MPENGKICPIQNYYTPILIYEIKTLTWAMADFSKTTPAEMTLLRNTEEKSTDEKKLRIFKQKQCGSKINK
jgi:hypothetical protein